MLLSINLLYSALLKAVLVGIALKSGVQIVKGTKTRSEDETGSIPACYKAIQLPSLYIPTQFFCLYYSPSFIRLLLIFCRLTTCFES